MSKKTFKKGFSGLLGEDSNSTSKKSDFTITPEPIKTPQVEKRATFIVSTEQLDALKAISFWERRMLKDVLNEALSNYISKYEKNNGDIKYPQ